MTSDAHPPRLPVNPTLTPTSWDWQLHARCRGMPAEVFFTSEEHKGERRRRHEDNAKRICLHCPVLRRCQRYALEAEERYGIWGATTPRDRDAMRQRQRDAHVARFAPTAIER